MCLKPNTFKRRRNAKKGNVKKVEEIVQITELPVIADADTGFGNAINVNRTVRSFERIGVAGLHIEDQTFPKRCGHLDDKSLVSINEMTHKIRVAKQSQSDDDFVVIARTDAIAVEGFSASIDRSKAYLEAGADVIFVEAPETVEQIEKIAELVPGPKLINMFYGGKTPMVSKDRLREMGYRLIIIPSDLQRATIFACQKALEAISEFGDSESYGDYMASFSDREQIIRTSEFLSIDEGFSDNGT